MAADRKERKETRAGEERPEPAERLFSTEQLLASERYRDRRDILTALLTPGEQYAFSDVEQRIEKYRKGQVR